MQLTAGMVNENGLIILNLGYPPRSRHILALILKGIAESKVKDVCAGYISGLSRVSRLDRLCRHFVYAVSPLFLSVLCLGVFCVAEVTWLTGVYYSAVQ